MVLEKHFFTHYMSKSFLKSCSGWEHLEMHMPVSQKAINTLAEPYACSLGTQNYSIIPESLWNVNPGAWNAVYFSRSTKWKPLTPQIHQMNGLFHLPKWTVRNNGHVTHTFASVPQRGKTYIPNKAASFFRELKQRSMGKRKLDLYSKVWMPELRQHGLELCSSFALNTQEEGVSSLPLGCRRVSKCTSWIMSSFIFLLLFL